MCGLIGGQGVDPSSVDLIRHRGPDAQEAVEVDGWTLGHTRLAIQDVTDASTQPWRTATAVVTYNGELWRPDQARTLLSDHEWETTGDTEIVAELIDHGGSAILHHFDGMFALAWVQHGDLFLARDPYGEVPLHYGWTLDGRFVYSSEIGPLLAVGAVPSTVRWVLPGHVMQVRSDGTVDVDSWFVEPAADPSLSMRDLLAHGVEGRLTSDVPVALLISGGLDSSAIASLAVNMRPGVVGYTAVHHAKSNDRKHAQIVANRLGIELREVPVPVPSGSDLQSVVDTIEMPHKAQVEIGWACLHLARRLERDGFRVVLSGEGADELFASYGMAYHGIQKLGWDGYRRDVFMGQHRKNFARTNKVFMRHGVEARLPFLDPVLAANVLTWDKGRVTADGRHVKGVLAEAFADDIGDSSAWRGKAAFQTDAKVDRSAAAAVESPVKFYKSRFAGQFQGVKA